MKLLDYLNFDKRKILGLDIGTSSVKSVRLEKFDGKYSLKSAAKVEISNSLNKKGQNSEKDTIGAIKKCVGLCGSKALYIVCAVNGPGVTVRSFKFPSTPEEEIGVGILREAEQVCPLEMQQSVVDYQLTKDSEDSTEVNGVLVAAGVDLIHKKNQHVTDAGQHSAIMDVNSLALLNCFFEFGQHNVHSTNAVLDIGNSLSNLIIVSDNSLPFIRSIPHGGREIAESISNELKLPKETVVKSLRCQIQPTDIYSFRNSLKKSCSILVKEVEETFQYYKTHENSCDINTVYICGGFALAMGIEDLLNESLLEHVKLWNPLENVTIEPDTKGIEEMFNQGPAMAVALGLAMRSI